MTTQKSLLPMHMWVLVTLYSAASLLHFIHNAEYLGFYPNMPAWITRQTVYVAWSAIAAIGLLGLGCLALGWRVIGLLALMIYAAMGFDGLGHYALALCSQHTWAQNFTIWFEVMTGTALLGTTTSQWRQESQADNAAM